MLTQWSTQSTACDITSNLKIEECVKYYGMGWVRITELDKQTPDGGLPILPHIMVLSAMEQKIAGIRVLAEQHM